MIKNRFRPSLRRMRKGFADGHHRGERLARLRVLRSVESTTRVRKSIGISSEQLLQLIEMDGL